MNETGSSPSYSPLPPETTEVLYGNDVILKKTLETFSWVKEKMMAAVDSSGPAIHVIGPVWTGLVQLKEKGTKVRGITDITPDDITHCKKLMEVLELRHLDGVKANFGVADGKIALLHGVSQATDPLSQAILTSVKDLVEAQENLFENLWKSAIPAEYKIKEMEEGVRPPLIETLKDPLEVQKLTLELLQSAKQEIQMLILPHTSSGELFLKEEDEECQKRIIQLLDEAVTQSGKRARILTSKDIKQQIEKLLSTQKMNRQSLRKSIQKQETGLAQMSKEGKLEIH